MSETINASSARRAQETLITPARTGTLNIDAQYHNTQISALFMYVFSLLNETTEYKEVRPIFVLKFNKKLTDEAGQTTSILYDLIDIRATANPNSDSLFGFNDSFAELRKVRSVFVNNKFYISHYLANEAYLESLPIVEFFNVMKVSTYQNKKTRKLDGPVSYYAWNTYIVTDANELYHRLNAWNKRIMEFENTASAAYLFEYAVADNEEALQIPENKRSPK